MNITMRITTVLAIALCCADLAIGQAYPARPIRMIVPFTPGGAADLIGRTLAQKLSENLGQQVFVENRTGASGNIGAEAVARAPADGYTILLGALTSHAINHTLERSVLRYNLEKDLAPVAVVATVPFVFVVHPSVQARSVRELIGHARTKPGQLTYGSSGAGAPQRMVAELFKLKTGIDMLHVPYKGGSAQVITDLLGGQIHMAFESIPAALSHIQASKLHALAVTTSRRLPMLPDVPTMAEATASGFEAGSMFGVLVPAGTPRTVIDLLNFEIGKIMRVPEVKDKLLQLGAFATTSTPGQAASLIHAEIAMWADVIRDAHITSE